MPILDANRIFPSEPAARKIAQELFESIQHLPIVSPHTHTNPRWFAENEAFENPIQLLVAPEHHVVQLLHSQGIPLESLGLSQVKDEQSESNARKIWRLLAEKYYLLLGTSSRLCFDHTFAEVFALKEKFCPEKADYFYDHISQCLEQPEFRPRALYERFNIELIATSEDPLNDLRWHKLIQSSEWSGRIITTYQPDNIVDPEHIDFLENLELFADITGEDTSTWRGYLAAHKKRRAYFRAHGATSTSHCHPNAHTQNMSPEQSEALFNRIYMGDPSQTEISAFRGQMLTEMARMSLDDGLVMQLHPGSMRNRSDDSFEQFRGGKHVDTPTQTDAACDLKPLLDAFGHDARMSIILFAPGEATQSRELAPLASAYSALRFGPPWWFYDSVERMRSFRQNTTETAGFYNTVGYNDYTRAFCSIPARHDAARRVDCSYLANLVSAGRINSSQAFGAVQDLTYRLVKKAYRL